jgi:type II secretory pathway component PulF
MSTYFYRALAPDGKIRTGTLAGEDDRAAVRELRRQGLTPVFVGASKP